VVCVGPPWDTPWGDFIFSDRWLLYAKPLVLVHGFCESGSTIAYLRYSSGPLPVPGLSLVIVLVTDGAAPFLVALLS
jgi:hypothetical protein